MEGYEPMQDADLKSGMKKLEHADIDLLLCYIKLPDGLGADFVKTAKYFT